MVILLCWYKRFSICLISFFNLHELFPAFMWTTPQYHIVPIVITTWLNFCKVFWWSYYADTKDLVSVWFHFLICMNYFQLSCELTLLEVWLIVCLELRFLIQFLFFFFWGINYTLSPIVWQSFAFWIYT